MTVDVGDGRLRSAWTYLYNEQPPEGRRIPSGNWRVHQRHRDSFVRELVERYCRTAGGEDELIRRLDARGPFPYTPEFLASLRPLWKAVARGDVSERLLAQQSKDWVVVPGAGRGGHLEG